MLGHHPSNPGDEFSPFESFLLNLLKRNGSDLQQSNNYNNNA